MHAWPLKTCSSCTWVTLPIWSLLVKQYQWTHGDPLDKLGSSHPAFQGHSRSSELTRISGVPDFLLTFHSIHGPILYPFQDIARHWPKKLQIFLNPRFFKASDEGFLWSCVTALVLKTRMMGLPGQEKVQRYLYPLPYNIRLW